MQFHDIKCRFFWHTVIKINFITYIFKSKVDYSAAYKHYLGDKMP